MGNQFPEEPALGRQRSPRKIEAMPDLKGRDERVRNGTVSPKARLIAVGPVSHVVTAAAE